MVGSSEEVEETGPKPQKKGCPVGPVSIVSDSQSRGPEFNPQVRSRHFFKKSARAHTYTHTQLHLGQKEGHPHREGDWKYTWAERRSGLRKLVI